MRMVNIGSLEQCTNQCKQHKARAHHRIVKLGRDRFHFASKPSKARRAYPCKDSDGWQNNLS